MDLKFLIFDHAPADDVMDGIIRLYSKIFDSSTEELGLKIKDKNKLVFNIAMDGGKVVGFKMGYELDNIRFYSWLGGVDPDYRRSGIASALMNQQHQYLKEKGYKVVQTKTMNRWRNMLVLNIRSGFDIIDTYIDEKGLHKIILEKEL